MALLERELTSPGPAAAHGVPGIVLESLEASVTETLTMVLGGETRLLSDRDDDAPCDGVLGIISFVGDPAWSFMLGLPRETASQMMLAFMGFEIDFDSPDMGDAVGEVANILAGDVVARLESAGVAAAMSLPTIARGHDVELMLPQAHASHRLEFEAPVGRFWIRVTAAREEGSPRTDRCPSCGR